MFPAEVQEPHRFWALFIFTCFTCTLAFSAVSFVFSVRITFASFLYHCSNTSFARGKYSSDNRNEPISSSFSGVSRINFSLYSCPKNKNFSPGRKVFSGVCFCSDLICCCFFWIQFFFSSTNLSICLMRIWLGARTISSASLFISRESVVRRLRTRRSMSTKKRGYSIRSIKKRLLEAGE